MERNEAKKQNILIPAEAVGNNIDLLTEILLRLQVKPLVTFKCVSKQWLSLISDPQFCLSHHCHHHSPYPTPTALLLNDGCNRSPELEMVPLRQDTIPKVPFFNYLNAPSLCIMQSCNGLFLCYSVSNKQHWLFGSFFVPEYNYYICNPATKQFKILSFPSFKFKRYLLSVCMAFDPLKSNHYKLICFRQVKHKEKCHIDLYSSEMDSWSYLGITDTAPIDMQYSNAVFWNGAVHWCIEDKASLYFDVDKECFNTMPMPNLFRRMVRYFGESQGHLHLIETELRPPLQFDVLEMAADYSGWFVKYHVNLDAVRIAFPDIIWYHEGYYPFSGYYAWSVVHVIQAQKEEESMVVVLVDGIAISCNVYDGTSKKLYDFEHQVIHKYSHRNTFQYFESLLSI